MNEHQHFIPPNNLFLLDPQHKVNLSGQNIRLHDGQPIALVMVMLVIVIIFWIPFSTIISQFGDTSFNLRMTAGLIAMACVLFSLSILLFLTLRRYRQNRKLEREGRLVIGYVVKADGRRHRSSYRVEIHYWLTSPDGRALNGREDCSRPDMVANRRQQAIPPLPFCMSARIYFVCCKLENHYLLGNTFNQTSCKLDI